MRFLDRSDAGRQVAQRLLPYGTMQPVVVALLRGGILIGAEVARLLEAPLDIIVVGKVGGPGWREDAIGAVGPNGAALLDSGRVATAGAEPDWLAETLAAARAEVARRQRLFRAVCPPVAMVGKTVLLVDDGLASGLTALAALRWLRGQQPRQVVIAAPVVAPEAVRRLQPEADALVYLEAPRTFHTVGIWYDDFAPIPDADVIACLATFCRRV